MSENLSGPYRHHCDDGSTLIEWAFNRARFGIRLESKPEESSWYLVAFDERDDWDESGCLPEWLKVEVMEDEETQPAQAGGTSESTEKLVSPQPWEPPVTTVTITDVGSDRPQLWREVEGQREKTRTAETN